MIINGRTLLEMSPITNMISEKHKEHGVSYGLSEAGYDIRLKQEIIFEPGFGDQPEMSWICDKNGGIGRFVLGSAIEHFQMPPILTGIVHDKSTWARHGLSVFNTVIEPGFFGGLTLELVYHGVDELHIPAGAGIAQVIFHLVSDEARYNGKYQNQSGDPEIPRFE